MTVAEKERKMAQSVSNSPIRSSQGGAASGLQHRASGEYWACGSGRLWCVELPAARCQRAISQHRQGQRGALTAATSSSWAYLQHSTLVLVAGVPPPGVG